MRSARVDTIPATLRHLPQWVLWRLVEREGKPTKVPFTPAGTPASVSDPNTWTDFETALEAYRRGRFDGIGFVLTADAGVVCVDIDHAKNGTDWTPEAMEMVGALNSYTEVSPSGQGLHIWCYGHLPAGRRRKNGVEMYDSGRFITVTGNHLAGTPDDLMERTAELADLHRRFFGETTTTLKAIAPADLSDEEVLQKAMSGKNGAKFRALWNGDTTGYPSQSEAELALCRLLAPHCGNDPERIERLVSQSALGQREKWRTRADYRQRTIQTALQSLHETYTGGHGNGHSTTRPPDVVEPEKIYRHFLHLTELLRNRYRWCPEWKTWLQWTGRVWERVPKEAVVTHAVEVLRDYYMECVRTSTAEAGKWAKRLADLYGTKHVADAVDLLSGHADFLTRAEQFDADPYVLNTPAGIVDLRSGQVRAHDPDALCTRITNGSPEPQARGERWKRFLHEIFAGDAELIAYVQKVCATAMLGYNREQVLYILYGTGANGKSVFLNTLLYVLGDYAGNIPRDALLVQAQAQDARRTAYASLVGIRFAVLDELEDRSRLSSTALKDLTSNNPQAARALYENYRQIRLGCTPFVGTNAKPEITEHSLGTWRRLRLVPFTVTIPPDRRDAELEAKLRTEADGIMHWLVEGLSAYWRDGLVEPPAVAQATQEYRSEEDALADWLSERTESHPRAITPTRELWDDYCQWAESNGISEAERLSEQAFSKLLVAHGYPVVKVKHGGRQVKARRGIRLLRTDTGGGVPQGTANTGFSKNPLRESNSGEVFENAVNAVPCGTLCVSETTPSPTQDEEGVTECNPIPRFSENSREVFQNAGNSVTSGYTCVSETTEPPALTDLPPRMTPLGFGVRAIEAALAGGKQMSKHDLQRATGLPPPVFEEALQHMLHTGQLIAEAGAYALQEAMDDG